MGERGEKFVLALASLHQGLGIGLELVALSSDLVTLLVELEEHAGLAAQDVALDWLVKETHRSGLITAKPPLAIGSSGGDKDDRDTARSLSSAHDLGEFVAFHLGHLNVEN